jgi:predicted CXXCH cytochrome family protein
MTSPDTSFGPRWNASSARQDDQCLACHADNVARHWQDALHMVNELTCVTCHDLHTANDAALNTRTQTGVCTRCHEAQKDGIHAIKELAGENPVCTTCHNPHADQRPLGVMLANRSRGCRGCHQPPDMQSSSSVSEKAKNYHKVMEQKDRTCLDCHRGIAHGPSVAEPDRTPQPGVSPSITRSPDRDGTDFQAD